jgi:hypothetical protein
MAVGANNVTPRALRGAFVSLIVLTICVLNLDTFLVNDVLFRTRASISAALLVGLAGTLQRNRIALVATTVVAWVGIALYFLFVTVTFIPGEMTRLAGYPPDQPLPLLFERFGLLTIIGIGVAVVFFKLTKVVRFS